MQGLHNISRRANSLIRSATVVAVLLAGSRGYADIASTSATVRSDNSLLVDVHVTTSASVERVFITYQTMGVVPLVSRLTQVSSSGSTTITIGRLRADRTYTYTVDAFDRDGAPAGTANGSFTTGPLPAALQSNTYTLTGRMTSPLVILHDAQPNFQGYVGLDLHSADAPQIVWYYSNAPSNASGVLKVDSIQAIVQEPNGNFLFADAGTGPPPLASDSFYREIAPDGTLVAESPATCTVTPPTGSPASAGWIWGEGNDVHEQLLPGADGVPGTVLHLGKIAKDPFFDAGRAPQGARVQLGTSIRRWNLAAGTDEVVWDPFNFLNPLTERTAAASSDPMINSDAKASIPCAGATLPIEEWMHANSLQVAPTGVLVMSVRHLDTVIAISPQFDRIAWRIGRFGSNFTFPNPSDRFYHQHYARVLDNGNLLLLDNGDGRPAAEGGQYTRALELALDWNSMTASKIWEYRYQAGSSDGGAAAYKYADKVGTAQRLQNGNTLVLFGADVDPATRVLKNPETFTLVEADTSPEAGAVAVLNMQIPPGNGIVFRALPVEALFGEVPGSGDAPSLTASPNPIPVTGTADGTTTINWNAPNAANIEVHVVSPNGPLFASGGNQGSAQTGPWVSDGTTFYLQDVTGGKPLTGSNTLATLVVHLQKL